MISRTITLATLLSFGSLLQGVHGEAMLKLKSMTSEQFKSPEWVNEIQLSGTFRLGGKGFASLTTPRENFWVEEGKSSSGYKLIELDTSKSQPSALIQKGDQQAWIGLRTWECLLPRTPRGYKRETNRGAVGYIYARGDKEPFNWQGDELPRSDGSKWLEWPYVHGKRHGTHIWYGDDGRISTEAPYVDGKDAKAWRFTTTRTEPRNVRELPGRTAIRDGTGIEYRRGRYR